MSSLLSIVRRRLCCRLPSTLRVSPPCSCARRVLSTPHATILAGDDGRPSALTSGLLQRPPPHCPAPFLDDAAVVAVVVSCPPVVPPPPLLPASVRALCIVQRIDRRCGKRASVVAFFSAPTVVGVPLSPSPLPLPLSSLALPPSGREKRPRPLGS